MRMEERVGCILQFFCPISFLRFSLLCLISAPWRWPVDLLSSPLLSSPLLSSVSSQLVNFTLQTSNHGQTLSNDTLPRPHTHPLELQKVANQWDRWDYLDRKGKVVCFFFFFFTNPAWLNSKMFFFVCQIFPDPKWIHINLAALYLSAFIHSRQRQNRIQMHLAIGWNDAKQDTEWFLLSCGKESGTVPATRRYVHYIAMETKD